MEKVERDYYGVPKQGTSEILKYVPSTGADRLGIYSLIALVREERENGFEAAKRRARASGVLTGTNSWDKNTAWLAEN